MSESEKNITSTEPELNIIIPLSELNITYTIAEISNVTNNIIGFNINNYIVTTSTKLASEIVSDFIFCINTSIDFFRKMYTISYIQLGHLSKRCTSTGLSFLDLCNYFLRILPIKDYNSTNGHYYMLCSSFFSDIGITKYSNTLQEILLVDLKLESDTCLDLAKLNKANDIELINRYILNSVTSSTKIHNTMISEFNRGNTFILGMLLQIKETMKKISNVQNYNQNN